MLWGFPRPRASAILPRAAGAAARQRQGGREPERDSVRNVRTDGRTDGQTEQPGREDARETSCRKKSQNRGTLSAPSSSWISCRTCPSAFDCCVGALEAPRHLNIRPRAGQMESLENPGPQLEGPHRIPKSAEHEGKLMYLFVKFLDFSS